MNDAATISTTITSFMLVCAATPIPDYAASAVAYVGRSIAHYSKVLWIKVTW